MSRNGRSQTPSSPASAPRVGLLYQSSILQAGALRQDPESPEWCGVHDTGPGISLGFPCRPMEYQRDHHDWVVGSANSVFLNNPNSQYRRRRLDPRGEFTEWLRFDLATALEVVRHYDPAAADLGDASMRKPLSGRSNEVFASQRRLQSHLRATATATAPTVGASIAGGEQDAAEAWRTDPLFVEETALLILEQTIRSSIQGDGQDPAAVGEETRRAHESIAYQATRYITSYFRTKLDAESIAREVGTSRPTLFRAFRAYAGAPVHQFLTTLRLREAFLRLESDSTPLTEVALDLGFSSHAHFTTLFRREFGFPPSAIRSSQD